LSDWNVLANAVDDLRSFLRDGPRDRFVKQKMVVGAVDGVNAEFYTFEDRIIDDVNFVITVDFLPVAAVLQDSIEGRFITTAPPPENSTVRARYYFQYFLDHDLELGLQFAVSQMLQFDDLTLLGGVGPGLKFAALNYAGSYAYQQQAMRWVDRMSHKFLLEEEPLQNDAMTRTNMFQQTSDKLLRTAEHLRDDFYKRAGRQFVPSMGIYRPRITQIGPRR
jgi:hypothetical protein